MIEVESNLAVLVGWIELGANLMSVLLVGAGVIVAAYKLLQTVRRPDLLHYNQARLAFTRYLVLALEFQLAADIVRTAIEPSWADLGVLAAVAAIRTFLNFFLQREMKNEEQEVKKALGSTGS